MSFDDPGSDSVGDWGHYTGGEKKVWSVVRVPSEEEEDGKNLGVNWRC